MNNKKLDLTKEYKAYYTAKTTPEVVEFREVQIISIEGKGAPGGSEFVTRVQALYPLAYGIKNLSKKEGRDFGVAKLEGLYWVEPEKSIPEVPMEEWMWKLLIRMPDFVTPEIVEAVKKEVIKKKKIELAAEIKHERMNEGRCVQILHIGPYAAEHESWQKMAGLMEKENLVANGLHHEIYLSDPGRVPEEKLKTILRQPVREKS